MFGKNTGRTVLVGGEEMSGYHFEHIKLERYGIIPSGDLK